TGDVRLVQMELPCFKGFAKKNKPQPKSGLVGTVPEGIGCRAATNDGNSLAHRAVPVKGLPMQRDYVPLFRSICTSDKLADLPDHECRLFYVLLLSQCDSWGRIADSPRALCASVWAMFGGTTKATVRAVEA